MKFRKTLIQLCVLVGCGVVMAADAPAAAPTPPATNSAAPDTQPAPLRDPTEPDPALRRALENLRPSGTGRSRALATPQVFRRALVKVKGKPPEALIEIQAAFYFVHEGSVITVGGNDGSTVMHVKRMTEDEIEIEVASQKQTMIVR